jgi:23S rRNA pseudouridine955/2504/2580 synthase
MKRIEILYEDNDCLVVSKPAGLPVQGGNKVSVSLDAILEAEWQPRPLLVHRLDKETSGVLLAAKSAKAAAYFSRLFAGKAVRKRYLAVSRSENGTEESGTINEMLAVRGSPKEAVTHYRRLSENCGFVLLGVELGTGRTHQIRRHLAQSRLPVLGDAKHGAFALNRDMRERFGIRRMLLHSSRLTLPLEGGRVLDVSAPLPDYFTEALKTLGLKLTGEKA